MRYNTVLAAALGENDCAAIYLVTVQYGAGDLAAGTEPIHVGLHLGAAPWMHAVDPDDPEVAYDLHVSREQFTPGVLDELLRYAARTPAAAGGDSGENRCVSAVRAGAVTVPTITAFTAGRVVAVSGCRRCAARTTGAADSRGCPAVTARFAIAAIADRAAVGRPYRRRRRGRGRWPDWSSPRWPERGHQSSVNRHDAHGIRMSKSDNMTDFA